MKYGEIITLGRHRLMCGDATDYRDVERLLTSPPARGQTSPPGPLSLARGGEQYHVDIVLTDPPYGINIVNTKTGKIGGHGNKYAPVIGDTNGDMFKEHYRLLRRVCNRLIIWGGQNFTDILPQSCGWLFWDKAKCSPALSFGDGELAWTNCATRIRKYTQRWNGSNIGGSLDINRRVHPTQKPVELHMNIINDFTSPGDVILDCFGGSGTTLIAAELTGRTCLMMEISPDYCDAIKQRYEILTRQSVIQYDS